MSSKRYTGEFMIEAVKQVVERGYSDPHKFCYEGDQGTFDNNAGVFRRFGSNTGIWLDVIDGAEVAEVWTRDFANRKALFGRSRGTGLLFPASVGAFVGDLAATETEQSPRATSVVRPRSDTGLNWP